MHNLNEIREAVENFKDYTSGHGYVLRTLAEEVLRGDYVRKDELPTKGEVEDLMAEYFMIEVPSEEQKVMTITVENFYKVATAICDRLMKGREK